MSEHKTLEEEILAKDGIHELNPEHPDRLYLKLLESIRTYHPAADDFSLVEKAYRVAENAHAGILRKSGEPYIIHPLHVAIILAELHMDKESIAAGLLHDVIEDTDYSKEQMNEIFGHDVTQIVDGVTKLTRMTFNWTDKEDEQADNLRKMILAMTQDIRVIIIKLADRLHNMRTMQYQKPAKQIEKSRETLEIYSPLASRLGISKVKIELDDYSLLYLKPDEYNKIKDYLDEHAPERGEFIDKITKEVGSHLKKNLGINSEVYGRVKHIFSIYKKMRNQNKSLEQIHDIFAIRIIVHTISECYQVLGAIHDMYTPVPGRFKDYIGIPKSNGYKSLHTTVVSNDGHKFEVQIRTEEMHQVAEYGIAAHWKYKEVKKGASMNTSEKERMASEIDKMTWLRELLLLQTSNEDNKEFIEELKQELNLFDDRVYAFTPNGKVINLPTNSTPVDFAYRIHTDVGNHITSAIVNGRVVSLDYKIQNGDTISINTSPNAFPSESWLTFVKSPQARTKIRQYFKNEQREDRIDQGRRMLEQYTTVRRINFKELATSEAKDMIARKYGYVDWNSVLAAVGHGALTEGQVINRMVALQEEKKQADISLELADERAEEMLKHEAEKINRQKNERDKQSGKKNIRCGAFLIKGYSGNGKNADIMIDCAHCCKPIPGDEIFGFLTRTRGIKVHRADCSNFKNVSEDDKARMIEVAWADLPKDMDKRDGYIVELAIYARDRSGLIVSVAGIISESGLNIVLFNTEKSVRGVATIHVRLNVRNPEELQQIIKKLNQSPDVMEVKRV